MSAFDPKGTSPGLTQSAPERPKVFQMRCRRDGCTSARAVQIQAGPRDDEAGVAPSQRLYQCVECKNTWAMAVGGAVSF